MTAKKEKIKPKRIKLETRNSILKYNPSFPGYKL